MSETKSNAQRFAELPEIKKKAIKELHRLCLTQVAYIDSLVAESATFESSYSLSACAYTIRQANNVLQDLEYRLQDLWGFNKDSNYHTWWLECRTCTCPKADNKDPLYYGHGKIINQDCPVHGDLYNRAAKAETAEWLKESFAPFEVTVELVPEGSGTKTFKGWLSESRLTCNIPIGLTKVALRHSDEDDSKPSTLEPNVYSNLYGEFLVESTIEFPPIDGYYKVLDWNFISE